MTAEQIYSLWDELVDFPAAMAEDALRVLMSRLCGLLTAQNFIYFGTVRVSKDEALDPVKSWRVHSVTYLHSSSALKDAAKEQLRNFQNGQFDLIDVRNAANVGTFRVNRLVDLVPQAWFKSPYYHRHYRALGHVDAIWAGIPVSKDAEVYCGIFRDGKHPAFTTEERDSLSQALRGLKWFHRQLMLGRGVMVAASPLTVMEQQVLSGLLSGKSEKDIAARLGHSFHTTHGYVRSIFRKFGVGNRAYLMALWLGQI